MLANLKDLQDFELRLYDNRIEMGYQVFIDEIIKKKSLFSTIIHLGKCIFNEDQIIITKIHYVEVLNNFKKLMDYKVKRRNQLLMIIIAIRKSRLRKFYRKEINEEIFTKF